MVGPCQTGENYVCGERSQTEKGKIKEKGRPKSLYRRTGSNSLPYWPRLWISGIWVLSRDSLEPKMIMTTTNTTMDDNLLLRSFCDGRRSLNCQPWLLFPAQLFIGRTRLDGSACTLALFHGTCESHERMGRKLNMQSVYGTESPNPVSHPGLLQCLVLVLGGFWRALTLTRPLQGLLRSLSCGGIEPRWRMQQILINGLEPLIGTKIVLSCHQKVASGISRNKHTPSVQDLPQARLWGGLRARKLFRGQPGSLS